MQLPNVPNNLEAEQATLAAVLINRDALIPIAGWLEPKHFYLERHSLIYAAMLACYRERRAPDHINVIAELKKTAQLEQVGGPLGIVEITDIAVISSHVESYAREVERCAVLRDLIAAGGKIAAIGYNQAAAAGDAIADAHAQLARLQVGGQAELFTSLAQTVDAYYSKIERVNAGEQTIGIPTVFRDLDEMTGGLHPDELTILAARPAVGKTSFLLSMAANIAQRGGVDVLIASLEMSSEQLFIRLLAADTGIDTHRLRTLQLTEAEQTLVVSAMPRISALPVFLADIAAMTVEQIRLAALRHISTHARPVVVMIDYLQLMSDGVSRTENRVQEVSKISRKLKNLTRELHAPVVALSQLSRSVESRENKRPILSDLRESGSIEQDGDNVWFLYRDELYNPETDARGIAELIIAKHRNGPIGTVPMQFDISTTRFNDLTWRSPEGY